MNKDRRDNLRAVVGSARRKVEDSLGRGLARYGLFVDREPLSRELITLDPCEEARYRRILDAVRRHGRAVGQGDAVSAPAVVRFVREAGGTWINRLAALRALEARGLLDPPAALVADDYGGLSPRAAHLRQQAAERGERLTADSALQAGIEDACRELSASVRMLFDLSDEQSLLWPDGATLRDVLRSFSTEVPQDDWVQPDVLGWVYQYYNAEANAELKRRKNRTTGFKYRPDDIPIANQFYTPHWVVRVLTDNTLGRLWLEMQNRLPRLDRQDGAAGEAHGNREYSLVERRRDVPHAADARDTFKAWVREEPDPLRDGTVDRLCRFIVPLPSIAPPRSLKPVREIRVLDPACGSGHFLLYAFDVLFAMYREAEPELDPRAIPALILEHNLFGIDIDLRAAQLAAFGLYLKARATLAAIDRKATLELRGLNIVVADAHINDDPRKAQFLERFRHDPEVQELYWKVLADLDHTNALGSLLKVRTEFETLFGRIRQRRQQAQPSADSFEPAQGVLIETSSQLALRETYRGSSGRTWTIHELLQELRRFEAEVVPGQDIGARLFYTDVERTVGLLALLSEQYEVVLMNPPYGDMPAETKDYLKGSRTKGISAHYPQTHSDLFAAFVDQALDLTVENGFVGGLVPWTYMYLPAMNAVRTEILYGKARPEVLQEYGYNILDGATVGTVATVARRASRTEVSSLSRHPCVFNRLSDQRRDWQKRDLFIETLPAFTAQGPRASRDWFVAQLGSLQDVPGMPYAYWVSNSLRSLFTAFPPLDRDSAVALSGRPTLKIADVKYGLSTKDDARFLRLWWETPREARGEGQKWYWLPKGGSLNYFYARVDHVVLWEDDGRELKEWASTVYGATHWSRTLQGHKYFFKPGLTFNRVSWRLRPFGLLGPGHIYSDKGPGIIPVEPSLSPGLLGLMASSLLVALRLLQLPERMIEVSTLSNLPIALPVPPAIIEKAHSLEHLTRERLSGDETCRDFLDPDLLALFRKEAAGYLDLATLLRRWGEARQERSRHESQLLRELDDEVYRLYRIIDDDRRLVESELARRVGGPSLGSGDVEDATEDLDAEAAAAGADTAVEDGEGTETWSGRLESASGSLPYDRVGGPDARDTVSRSLSYYVKQAIEADADEIVPIDATHGKPALVVRVLDMMRADIGREAADALSQQGPAYLGTADLANWVQTSREETIRKDGTSERMSIGFFPWHVALYRNRPVFWLVSSENFEEGRTRLTFRVYLHYLRLTADTLPRVLTHYLDPTIDRANREWQFARDEAARVEGRARAGAQKAAAEWANTMVALRGFRAAVESIIQGPTHARQVPANAKWLPRMIAEVRGGRDIGHGYRPDIDLGVRVNIAPLVEERLLPRVVLKRFG